MRQQRILQPEVRSGAHQPAGGPPFDDWVQVNTDGFGDPNNTEIGGKVIEYDGYLYAGTSNNATGGEVWRTAEVGPSPFSDWEQVNTDGFE